MVLVRNEGIDHVRCIPISLVWTVDIFCFFTKITTTKIIFFWRCSGKRNIRVTIIISFIFTIWISCTIVCGSIKNFINANSKDEIVFTKNATESINLVASTFGQENIKKGDEILITELEHHANYVPWHFIREKKGALIKFAKCNDKGEVDIDEIKKN